MDEQTAPTFELKKLSEKHKLVAALLAQGVDRRTIAASADYTPEYVTMLQGQPLFIEYVRTMNAAVATQLEAMFAQSVGIISEAMTSGSEDTKLKAAKLQLEATGRIGRYQVPAKEQGGTDRLEVLAGRLVELLKHQRRAADEKVVEGTVVREDSAGQERSQRELPRLQPNPG